jgi:hypothetical protein
VGTTSSSSPRATSRRGTFDPTTQDLSFVLRDDQGLVVNALVPGGNPGWTASATEITYADPAGTFGGVTSVSLRATPAFGTAFRATARIRTSLAAAADARTATAVLRIGTIAGATRRRARQPGRTSPARDARSRERAPPCASGGPR